jgi:putative oxidoreductase
MEILVLLGRVLYTAIFITGGINHLKNRAGLAAYSRSQGVPAADLMVPLTGLMILAGGLSVLLGFHARIGAWLIFLFLVPTAFLMHRFWGVPDPMMAQNQQVHFMKNMSMAGGALLIAYFGSGPYSIAP